MEVSVLQESLAPEEVAAEAAAAVEPEALENAEFLLDRPAMAELEARAPYLEPWIELLSGPAVIDVQSQNESFALSTAAPLSLNFQPNASPAGQASQPEGAQASLTPREFKNAPDHPGLPWKVINMHQLPSAGQLAMPVAASVADFRAEEGGVQGVNFETVFLIRDSHLLELPFTGILFPAEDSEVQLDLQQLDSQQVEEPATDLTEVSEDNSPRASLEALSRLHQDLVEEERTEQVAAEQTAPPAESEAVAKMAEPVIAPAPQEAIPLEAELVNPPQQQEQKPGHATELLDVSIRMFPPVKPAPIAGLGLAAQSEPLLPRLKGLPMRPKVAVATGYVPPSADSAQAKAVANPPKAGSTPTPTPHKETAATGSKGTSPTKPAAFRIAQPKPPAAAAKAPSFAAPKPASKFQAPSQAAVEGCARITGASGSRCHSVCRTEARVEAANRERRSRRRPQRQDGASSNQAGDGGVR